MCFIHPGIPIAQVLYAYFLFKTFISNMQKNINNEYDNPLMIIDNHGTWSEWGKGKKAMN